MDTTIPTATTTIERPVRLYLERVNRALFSPARFYREDFPSFSTSEALAFGIVSAWLAAALAFALETLGSLFMSRLFESWVQRMMATETGFSFLGLTGVSFLWTAGLLLLGPFIFLIRIFFGSLMVYAFARLLIEDEPGAPEAVTFSSAMRIQATAFCGQWYSVVPFFGPLLAFIAGTILLITGVRERYRVSGRRAAVVVLAPYFFLALGALLLTLLLVFAFFQLPFEELFRMPARPYGF